MDSKNRVTVEIFGELYALKGDIKPERVIKLAAVVDKRMKTIAKTNSQLPPLKVAVLAALNLADEYTKLEQDYNQLIEMLKDK
ncbi:cell division protein ZapA [Dendrosporobacter sp. 1207_IL3150]|uniref:cell division protein ZapA n=1 Tax=Dendrosporobacter sp. 1207_IL3150 TaxID=3084054 RepID=UPI002FD9E4EE